MLCIGPAALDGATQSSNRLSLYKRVGRSGEEVPAADGTTDKLGILSTMRKAFYSEKSTQEESAQGLVTIILLLEVGFPLLANEVMALHPYLVRPMFSSAHRGGERAKCLRGTTPFGDSFRG